MLKRLLALSAGTPARDLANLTSLPPVSLLDGFGHAVPGGQVQCLPLDPVQRHDGIPGHDAESGILLFRAGNRLVGVTE